MVDLIKIQDIKTYIERSNIKQYINYFIPNNLMTKELKNKTLQNLFILVVFILLIIYSNPFYVVIIFAIFYFIYRKININEKFISNTEPSNIEPSNIELSNIELSKKMNNDKNVKFENQINTYANINFNAENIEEFKKWCYPNNDICKNNPSKCLVNGA